MHELCGWGGLVACVAREASNVNPEILWELGSSHFMIPEKMFFVLGALSHDIVYSYVLLLIRTLMEIPLKGILDNH